ncbi:MAG: T9SS type A sorting domain-containing protein [Candidatus Marinimicrobia bacterium]|nr:T9SS type A sorting domain-containing protein [Candidatus Neomarinimicrobiota bacterium]MCF7829594.1 T9SS type A sorting domain-containing protein [Candidatus Neomarinimicrobiota bacterium]MCF7882248.1 T9SS type A sorting domain-containing protein [Candidatus Neomarinimicrobiota bacterium]
MKRLLVLVALLGLGGAIQAQTHFTVAYSGNPYNAMNIYVSGATIDGVGAEAGDEIGLFDGDICVGAAAVTGPISMTNTLDFEASSDDPTTTDVVDGFKDGNPMLFRIWDSSTGVELTSVTVEVVQGDETFVSQGTAAVSLIGVTNQPPVIEHPVPDISLLEDAPDTAIADLDTVFLDPESQELTMSVNSDNSNLSVNLSLENICTLSIPVDWYGTGEIYLIASDGELTTTDTVLITVTSVNDNPSIPVVLLPESGAELVSDGLLVWTLASDPEEDAITGYRIQVDDNGQFSDPEVDEVISIEGPVLARRPALMYNPQTQVSDSAYVISLDVLSQYGNLTDDTHYTWRVRSIDVNEGESEWSEGEHQFFFNKSNTAPKAPTQGFNPADSVSVSSLAPTISWNAAFDPDLSDGAETLAYQLQVSSSTAFVDTLYDVTTDPGQTSVESIGVLKDNSLAAYRVKTMDDEGLKSKWSVVQEFLINTALDPPLEFLVQAPATGDSAVADSTNFQAEVTFQWTASGDPDLNDIVQYFVAYTNEDPATIPDELTWDDLMDFVTVMPLGSDTAYTTSLDTGFYSWVVIALDTDTLWTFGTNADGDILQHLTVWSPTVGVNSEAPVITEYQLLQNYPNPFNPTTTIHYALPAADHVTIAVYDLQGRKIRTLVDAKQTSGWHTIKWNALNNSGVKVSAGVYFYQIQTDAFRDLKKMILLK